MSWLYSRALVEEYSGDTSLDGEPSVQSNGNPTQLAYLPLDRMTDFSRLSRFGMTFKPLTEDRGEALLMSYLEGFRAKTSPQPEKVQELTENGQECGEKWPASFTKYDQDSCSWKTHQCLLLGDLEEFSETWPRWGLMRNGECWEQQRSAPLINATESGLWRTPQAQDGMRGVYKTKEAVDAHLSRGHQLGLANQVAHRHLWPTPTVCGNYNRKGLSATSGDGLATAVQKWPTPIASDSRGSSGRPAPGKQTQLVDAVRFATPLSRDWKSGKASQATMERNSRPLSEQIGGSLNPDWVEWLMNWPITWSGLNAVNRKEFQRWQEASATALQESGQLRTMWWDRDPSQAPSGQRPNEQPEQELGGSLQQVSRVASCQSEMEGSHEGSNLPLLRDSLHLQAGEGEDMQQGMWEQAGLDEAQIVPRVASGITARVDRLKAIGNGQVPAVAATAWRLLA